MEPKKVQPTEVETGMVVTRVRRGGSCWSETTGFSWEGQVLKLLLRKVAIPDLSHLYINTRFTCNENGAVLGRLKQKNREFQTILGYLVRPVSRRPKKGWRNGSNGRVYPIGLDLNSKPMYLLSRCSTTQTMPPAPQRFCFVLFSPQSEVIDILVWVILSII
jgi:hypothetical protein